MSYTKNQYNHSLEDTVTCLELIEVVHGSFQATVQQGQSRLLTLWKVNLLLSLLETTDQCMHISFPRVLVPLGEPMSSEDRMFVDAVSCFVLSFIHREIHSAARLRKRRALQI